MKVGVPTEVKVDEYRVALTPAGVRELVDAGHDVHVQQGAGLGSAITDEQYSAQGAKILPDAPSVFGESDMIVKVKEPQPPEVAMLEPRHLLFTYLHLAADKELTEGLMACGATCIAYETVEVGRTLPLLAPMSEVAGKIATQAGAFMLEEAARRSRDPARWGSRCRRGERHGHRRGCRRDERGADRARDAGDGVRLRPQHRSSA